MKVFTCTKFQGYWPVGSAAIVTADDEVEAAKLLTDTLREMTLDQEVKPEWMVEVFTYMKHVTILVSGDC